MNPLFFYGMIGQVDAGVVFNIFLAKYKISAGMSEKHYSSYFSEICTFCASFSLPTPIRDLTC